MTPRVKMVRSIIGHLVKNTKLTYTDMGEVLGFTRSRIHQLARDTTLEPGKKRFSRLWASGHPPGPRPNSKTAQRIQAALGPIAQHHKLTIAQLKNTLWLVNGFRCRVVLQDSMVWLRGFPYVRFEVASPEPLDFVLVRSASKKWYVFQPSKVPAKGIVTFSENPGTTGGAYRDRGIAYRACEGAWHLLKKEA